jgi:MraZ protein
VASRFRGEYHHTIDKKGRMSIPAKFREGLGEHFMFSKGPDQCLYAYPMEEWERVEERIENSEVFSKAQYRAFVRNFFSSADEGETDAMGRVLVPPTLREYAGLTDKMDVTVIGVANRVEIWAAEKWNAYCDDNAESMDVSEGMEIFDI